MRGFFKTMNKTETIIYFVRHGESLGNLNRVCLGHTDLDITDLGRKQARKTADALSMLKFAAIYSSDLIRAVNTAKPHAEIRGMEVIPSIDFRELYFGDWENSSVDFLVEHYRDDFTVGWRQKFGTFTAPNGESVVEMAKRMALGAQKIARKHPGENILIVSHAAAIRALWGKISGLDPEAWVNNPFPSNASYSIVKYDGEKMIPCEYSVEDHLGEMITNILPIKK